MTHIQVLLSIFIFFIIANFSPAQIPNSKVSGVVVDKNNGLPLEAADVSLFNTIDSSIVTGTNTDASGKFTLSEISSGKYNLIVRVVGYNTAVVNGITITNERNEIFLDTIKIKSGSDFETDVIEIESEKPLVQFSADKKIFNVSKDLTTTGGNALDVLKNIPSVQVDVDGNVSLRGSQNLKILVDGKPFGLEGSSRSIILQQIPSNSIESVELITNPSAKYNPEGTSGIVNIILKKNSDVGYNGNVTLNAGTSDKYNGSINLNLKNEKFNIFGSYSYSNHSNDIVGSTFRQNLFPSQSTFTNQINSGLAKRKNHLIKTGLDYSINSKNSLSLLLNFNIRNTNRTEINSVKEYDSLSNPVKDYFGDNSNEDNDNNFDLSLNYSGKFKNPKQTLNSEISYSKNSEDEFLNSKENFILPANNNGSIFNNYEKENSDLINLQLDYEHPLGNDTKLEAGYRSTIRKNDNDFRLENFDYNTNTYIPDVNSSSHFTYNENIHALYAMYSNKIKDFSFLLGVRGEMSNVKGDIANTDLKFNNDYFSLFPSISLSQKLSLAQEIQLSYSRRINRPRMGNLNPYPDLTDPVNISVGNPNLKPEYINSFELSYINYLPFGTLTPSIFYRQVNDEISRYRYVTDSNTTVTTFENLNSSRSYGLEFLLSSQILKWWSVNGNFSYYRTEVDANNISSGLTNETNSWSTRFSSSMNIPDLFDVQISYLYTGKRVSAIATLEPMHSLDAAVKKDFFDRMASLSFRVSDIFNTMEFRSKSSNGDYIQESIRRRNNRTAYLTFTLNLGIKDKNDRKKPERKETEPDIDEDY